MSRVFVDTSAVYALLVPEDQAHEAAKRAFALLAGRQAALVTSSYVLVETCALLTHRVGLDAVRAFRDDFAPLLEVVWVDAELHDGALDRLLAGSRQGPSLVDLVSFAVIRASRIDEVFAFDRHFGAEGFLTVS